MKQAERYPPDDPREWMNRARSSLARARTRTTGAYFEDMCFDAQQAAEKAVKAVMIRRRIEFPYVHDLRRLLSMLDRAGETIPETVRRAVDLTDFATITRYPGMGQPVTEQQYLEAIEIAATVVRWAEEQV